MSMIFGVIPPVIGPDWTFLYQVATYKMPDGSFETMVFKQDPFGEWYPGAIADGRTADWNNALQNHAIAYEECQQRERNYAKKKPQDDPDGLA